MKLTDAERLRRGYPVGHERDTLTPNNREVISLVCDGLTNAEIAERLGIKQSTVKSHLTRIYRLEGVTSDRQLLAKYLRAASCAT